jgi:hypothetical protein
VAETNCRSGKPLCGWLFSRLCHYKVAERRADRVPSYEYLYGDVIYRVPLKFFLFPTGVELKWRNRCAQEGL